MDKVKNLEKQIKRLEQRVEELERNESAIEAAGFDVWENNWISGETYGTNRRTFTSLGYSEEELPKNLAEVLKFIHPEDEEKSLQIIEEYFSGKRSTYYTEVRVRAKDGSWVWFANAGKVISRNSSGQVERFVGMSYNIDARKKAENEREEIINRLQSALAEIKTLRGIVPICASCKKIRDDQGFWNQVEAYVAQHTEASFSHSLCPDCFRTLYPEMADRDDLPDI